MNNFGLQEALAVAGLAVTVVGGMDFLIRWYFNSHVKGLREVVKDLQRQVSRLDEQLLQKDNQIAELQGKVRPPDWVSDHAQSLIDQERRRADEGQARADALDGRLRQLTRELEVSEALLGNAQQEITRLNACLEESRSREQAAAKAIEGFEKGDKARSRIVERTLELEGKVWLQDILHGAHRFIPLPERKTPIISVLNLKGGVGKTTLTAYLAWAMVRRGYRVLMVDLDLQGSLSSLFLSEPQLKARHDQRGLLRDYLAHAAREKHARIDLFTTPIERLEGKADLLATSDMLGYQELNLTFQWLFRIGRAGKQWSGRRDVRLLLRRGLHRKGLKKQYDLVLLDCPPLVNLCCVNALAASDYVLVPVTPSRKALERVPPLLGKVREIMEEVNRDLGVLGVVANRTQRKDEMTPAEKDLWNELPQHCQDVFNMPVHRFETFLSHRVLVRDAEANFPPLDDQDMQSTIDKLAAELEGRLPQYCRGSVDRKARGLFDATEVSP